MFAASILVVSLLGAAAWAAVGVAPIQETSVDQETVFLIHGMGRSRLSMKVLEARLRRAGYRTVNLSYLHAVDPIEEIASSVRQRLIEESRGGPYHIITHSLGGVILREASRKDLPGDFRRAVMLAPPNRPALLAKGLKGFPPYRWITGDSGQRLADPEYYRTLPAPAGEFAVIAGKRGNRLFSDEPNDGVVLVSATPLGGMSDFRVVSKTHTFLMNSQEVFELCDHFLKTGSFSSESEAGSASASSPVPTRPGASPLSPPLP